MEIWVMAYISELCGIQEKPTHKQAHLVFADTQPKAEKPKEPVFYQRSDEMNEI